MPVKICFLLLFSASSVMAAHPFAPYFGIWNGTGSVGNEESNLTLTMKSMGPLLTGNFNARPKKGGKSYAGTLRGTAQPDGCYQVTVTVLGQPQAVEVSACLQPDKSIAVSSMLANGKITPWDKFTRLTFDFDVLMNKATGTLYKKGAQKAVKKKKRRAKKASAE
jgi:hypothetical protein